MKPVLAGTYGGFIATGPMTLLMFGSERALPEREQSPLPPATLSYELVKRFFPKLALSNEAQSAIAMTSHFSYGAAAGGVYGALSPHVKMNPVLKGVIFGLGVWSGSYLGIAPALDMRARAPNMPASRNLFMIAAHVVWGAALGYATAHLEDAGNQMLAGKKKAPDAE